MKTFLISFTVALITVEMTSITAAQRPMSVSKPASDNSVAAEQKSFSLADGYEINLFASECENCPNILLEAMASGRPVICSNDPPMPEFGQDAVLYFNPRDPAQLTDQLTGLLDDPDRQAQYGAKAKRRSTDFRVDDAMRRTWESLLELAETGPAQPDERSRTE